MKQETKKLKLIMQRLQSCYNELAEMMPEEVPQLQYESIFEDEHYNKILKVVTDVFETNPLEDNRTYETAMARHALRYLLRFKTPRSYKSIGKLTLNAEHSTVMNSIRIAKNMIEIDEDYANMINKCAELIKL